MDLKATVRLDLSSLKKLSAGIQAGLNSSDSNPVQACLRQWAALYRSFAQERYNRYSRGGGDWKPLAKSTVDRRRKPARRRKSKGKPKAAKQTRRYKRFSLKRTIKNAVKTGKKVHKSYRKLKQARTRLAKAKAKLNKALRASILRDTNTLFTTLNPVFVGAPGAIQEPVAYGIRVGFGGSGGHPGGPTVAEIAEYHQLGGKNLPQRKIIVEPPDEVLNRMAALMERAVKRLSDDIK